jgi:hypothetical protein
MAQIGTLETFSATDTVSAQPLQYNYVEIRDKYNEHDAAITDVHGITSPAYILNSANITTILDKYCPVGTIKYIWDNDLTVIRDLLSSDKFKEFDGTICSDADSPYYNVTLPDMDQCYIVGAGTTDGSGDIATASIALTKCGNVIASFDHDHTTIAHVHTLSSHSHTDTHYHDFSTVACLYMTTVETKWYYRRGTGISTYYNTQGTWLGGEGSTSTTLDYGVYCTNTSESKTTANGSTTGTLLTPTSFTQSYNSNLEMRPLSCKIKAYLRIK